jgi:hypothetical protein
MRNVLFEAFKILLGAALALAGGAFLLVVTKLFAEPLNEQKKVIADVARAVLAWSYVFTAPREAPRDKTPEYDQAMSELHGLAAKLMAATAAVPWYWLAECRFGAPSRKSIDEAARTLRVLANTIYYTPGNLNPDAIAENYERANSALKLIKIDLTI